MTQERQRTVSVGGAPSLGALLDLVERGETVVLTRDGTAVAVLTPPDRERAFACAEAREQPAAYQTSDAAGPASALLRLVGGAAARAVLGVFVKEPQRPIHQREVARRAGVGLRSAQLALDRLEALGLIGSERDGNRRYYRASRGERFEGLRGLLAREYGLPGAIARAFEPLGDRLDRVLIFGSAAQGRDTVDSDVDLLVVGDVSRDDLSGPIAQAQRDLGREIDVVLYRRDDLRKKRETGNHFVQAVLSGPHVDVIGGSDDS